MDFSEEGSCKLRYQKAKALRNMKKFSEAKLELNYIIKHCPEETKMNARYLNLVIAGITSDESMLPEFDSFVKDYPKSTLSDDVLYFKANLYKSLGRLEESRAALIRILEEYPQGDMASKTNFVFALEYAKKGDQEKAQEFLREEKHLFGSLEERAKARYWRARLLLYSDPAKLGSVNANKLKQATGELLSIKEQNKNIYSFLSYKLLERLKIKDKKITLPKAIIKIDEKALGAELGPIADLIRLGFRVEAIYLLDEISLKNKDNNFLTNMAMLYYVVDRPEKALQRIIKCGAQGRNILKEQHGGIYYAIILPKAYENSIKTMAQRYGINSDFFQGLIRQESVFLPDAVSWAGASGLGQLMPKTAEEQAKALKWPILTKENIFEPEKNLEMSASLLSSLNKRFSHLAFTAAGYNAGPGPAAKWQKSSTALPLDLVLEEIPYKETKNYIMEVISGAYEYAKKNNSLNKLNIPFLIDG